MQAVIENIALKQQIFLDIEKYCSPSCVLSTNTSTIDLNLVGAKTRSQDRILGAHFFRFALLIPMNNFTSFLCQPFVVRRLPPEVSYHVRQSGPCHATT